MRSVVALVVVLAGAAGCLSPQDAQEGPDFALDWSERAIPFGDGHDHADPLQHAGLTTPNFEVLGREPMFSPYYGGQSAGAYICGDAKDTDGRRIAAVESRSEVGFALADVSDPLRPQWLGEFVMESTYVYDLAVVPGGNEVVLVTRHSEVEGVGNIPPGVAADAESYPAPGQPTLWWRTPCDPAPRLVPWTTVEDPVPRPMSLVLVDISDPAAPAVIDQHPLAGFGHSAYSETFDGLDLLLVTTMGPATAAGTTSAFELYGVVDTPAGRRLEPQSVYRAPAAGNPAIIDLAAMDLATGRVGHDGWMAVHPATGQTLAYLVGSDLLTILDIEDPGNPRVTATWSEGGPGREGYSGVLHSVVPLPDLRNGRHYTIVGPEWGAHPVDHPSGIVWVLDTTDPGAPFEVAAWTLPHEVEWNGTYMFSNHYYGVVGDTLFISMYHGGVWAVDLAPLRGLGAAPGRTTGEDFLLLPSIGVFVATDPAADPAVEVRWTPNSQEVLTFGDGTLLTFDSWTGLWTYRFDATRPAPAPEPWPVQPVHARG